MICWLHNCDLIMAKKKYTFIDLFAGIGGFHTALHSVGGRCVFASEWDKNARLSYEANYKEVEPKLFKKNKKGEYLYFNEDINDADPKKIPDFDICCGGFPCQPFSVAGLKKGFEDTRGTLFFNIANIVKEKIQAGHPPRVLFLENVRGLKNHDRGNTLKVILATLDELGYGYSYEVLNAKYFGVPQNRERLFIIAWYKDLVKVDSFKFPYGISADGSTIYEKEKLKEGTLPTKVSDIFEPSNTLDPCFTISDRMWEGHKNRKQRNKMNGKGFGYSVDLVCTVCSHSCPICRTNNKHAISKIISKDNNQYIRLSGTMSALNQTINRLKNDYVFLSEPVFYMSRDSEIYHVNIECQRK